MSSSSGPDIISNGLVLSLDASDKKSYPGSGITWVDRSGNSYNGTLSGGVTYNSSSAGSLVFDGVDDHVVWNTLSALKWQNWNSITIEAVFKLTSYTGGVNGRQYLFDFRDNGGVDGAIGCFHDTNIEQVGLKLFYNTVGNAYEEPLITSFSLNSLIYYQLTFDKTTSTNNIKHYINGNNVFTRSVTINSNTSNAGRIWIGRYSGGSYQWNGNIYNFKAYNRALSQQEISQNFKATKSRFGL